MGFLATTWPFGILEVGLDSLVIRDESMKREYRFRHSEVEKIEIRKIIPFIACGIRIIPVDKMKDDPLYYWSIGPQLKKILVALKESGWIS